MGPNLKSSEFIFVREKNNHPNFKKECNLQQTTPHCKIILRKMGFNAYLLFQWVRDEFSFG